MSWLERKYIFLLSNRLQNFKRAGNDVYKFRCPFCGDSEKNKTKTRGYLFPAKNTYIMFCHNCSASQSFSKFLRYTDLILYNEYVVESLLEKDPTFSDAKRPTQTPTNDIFADLDSIASLPLRHFARKYVVERKIPDKFYNDMYYCAHFKTFVNGLIPDKFKSHKHDNARLILPFRTQDGKCFGFHGRALDPLDQLRYIAIFLNENEDHLFGLDRVDFNKKYYTVEGPIDSYFLNNCLAVGGGDLALCIQRAGLSKERAVMVHDNEPRNKEIVGKVQKSINRGLKVVIWPKDIVEKDINDMILNGLSSSELQHIIDTNTFDGLEAQLALANWSKI